MTLYTTNADIPYPEGTDPANGPAAFQGIALAADTQGLPVYSAYTDRDAAMGSVIPGQMCVVNGNVMLYNDQYVWVDLHPRYSLLAADTTSTTATYANVSALSATMEPNGIYIFTWELAYTAPTAGDIKVQPLNTFSLSMVRLSCRGPASTNTDSRTSTTNGAMSQSIGGFGFGGDGSRRTSAYMSLTCQNINAVNTITFQWAQQAASGTSTLHAGSHLVYQKIG